MSIGDHSDDTTTTGTTGDSILDALVTFADDPERKMLRELRELAVARGEGVITSDNWTPPALDLPAERRARNRAERRRRRRSRGRGVTR